MSWIYLHENRERVRQALLRGHVDKVVTLRATAFDELAVAMHTFGYWEQLECIEISMDKGEDDAPFVGDFLVLAPTWLAGGVLLWRRRALGYVAGAGLLYVAGTLFAGVSLVVVFPTRYSGAPLDVGGVITVLAAAAICIVPFAFYVRGIIRS